LFKAFLLGSFGTLLGTTIGIVCPKTSVFVLVYIQLLLCFSLGYLLLKEPLSQCVFGLANEDWKIISCLTAKNIGAVIIYLIREKKKRLIFFYFFVGGGLNFMSVAEAFQVSKSQQI
jgi:hypothetical protein